MRGFLTGLTILVGVVLAIVSYFFMAAPLGQSTNESFSNPRVPFAATGFVIGVALLFISAIVYEVFPEPESESESDSI
jgi:uncharacterized membrane protein required for colicin V production